MHINVDGDHIGDTIASFPAILAAAEKEKTSVFLEAQKCVGLLPFHHNLSIVKERQTGTTLNVQHVHRKYGHLAYSMPRAYMLELGVDGEDRVKINYDRFSTVWRLVVAPISYSDLGTGTKTWPFWKSLLYILSEDYNIPITIVCGDKSESEPYAKFCDVVIAGQDLVHVAGTLKNARLVLTVDNGINWMCQGVDANHILLNATGHPMAWSGDFGKNALNLKITDSLSVVLTHILERL